MPHLKDIVFDAHHPASIARFWAAVLDGYAVAPYDEAELERLRANGIYDIEDDPSVIIDPPAPDQPRLIFQLVPESKVAKNRVHLDLACDDLQAEKDRLITLGAKVQAEYDHLIRLEDPEGNEFCICAQRP